MFLEALTSRFHVVFFGLLPRALVLQWSTLWTFDGPLETRSPFRLRVVEAATMLVSRCHVR